VDHRGLNLRSILITGGCGFIGFNLVTRILDVTTARVIVVDKLTYASSQLALNTIVREPRVTFVRADIADRAAMSRVFDEHRPSAVMNLAAETHVDRSIDSSWQFVETNVRGTVVLLEESRHLLDALTTAERENFRFLHVSTDEVFGSLGSSGTFSEATPYAPTSPYAASKAAADHLVRAFAKTHNLPTLITNCSNNYGPYQHPEKLIPLTILNALDARPLPIYGDGRSVRDWLHVDDHCAALLLVLRSGRPGESYNVGASNERSTIQVVSHLCDTLDELCPARSNPAMLAKGAASYHDLKQFVTDRPGHDRRYAVDASKLRAELGWTPHRAFGQGLRETVQWYMTHRDALAAKSVGYDRERLGLRMVTA
jgi:dTDP-glucose 4,6-dehydratase